VGWRRVVGVYVDIDAHYLLCLITKIEKKEKIYSENEIILLLVQKCAKKIVTSCAFYSG
jgi:hypothetical protein